MVPAVTNTSSRRPRFRRASEPLAFRLTDDDVQIIRLLARYRFLQSTQLAALVVRSVDRTNKRLLRLFHAGYVDRPRAQLDQYQSGSGPMVYALADRGAQLLTERGTEFANREWTRKNDDAGRPFIEHQLGIVDFRVKLEGAARGRTDIRIIHPEEIVAILPEQTRSQRNPLALLVSIPVNGTTRAFGLIPDLVFGLMFSDGSRRCFMVEIDRGTMPISRSDFRQTSIERKMRCYLMAHATRQHEQHFEWKTFRVLVVTTDDQRIQSMREKLKELQIPNSIGASLFLFATTSALAISNPLSLAWRDGNNREVGLLASSRTDT